MTASSVPRIEPLAPPYDPAVARTLARMMPPGMEPLKLFRTVAHHPYLLDKFRSTGTYLLNFGTVDPWEREVVIHRVCARCGAEYEWGVHAVAFGRPLGFTEEQLTATVVGDAGAPGWPDRARLLIRLVDELHQTATISDGLWQRLVEQWTTAQLIELIVLVGQYHLVAFLTNGLRIELEDSAARFPAAAR